MIKYLNEKKHEHNLYNFFNRILIELGQSLYNLNQVSTFSQIIQTSYSFIQFQQHLPSQIPQQELQNFERQILDELDIKIKIKKDQEQNIMFPSWKMLLEGLTNVGKQFMRISQMHQSNKEIIDMVNGKIIQDFQFIQSEIKKSLKSLDQIQKTSQLLKKQNQDFLSGQRNVSQHQMDLMFLLKQQYYKFQDFQLRIKQNQKNYHIQTKKLSYFREKLGSFSRKNRQKYQKIFKTRFFAILDSYNISIEQSIRAMRKVISMNHYYIQSKPPKVNRLQIFKNVDQQIQAQKKYQNQYLQRARFYNQISQNMIKSMDQLKLFLQRLHFCFQKVLNHSQPIQKRIKQSPQYTKNFSMVLVLKFFQTIKKIQSQSNHLLNLHSRFTDQNKQYLLLSQNRSLQSINQAISTLSQLSNPKQPIQYKYKIIKLQLQNKYQIIQTQIQQIKRFQQIYLKHSNRLKKTLLMQILYFLHLEKLYMNQSDFIKNSSIQNLQLNNNQGEKMHGVGGNKQDNQEEKEDNVFNTQQFHVDNIYTGQYLTQEYTKVVNKFLFVAYSEWKNSQFFKETLSKQLYVLLNKEENENISEVIVESLQLAGYPPEILWVRQLHSENFQFLADLSVAFKGKIIIFLKTQYKLMGISFPTQVKVQVQQLYCVIRLCFVPSQIGQSWFSFIGQPIAKFTVQPKIYTISINVQTIRNFFSNLLLKKLKQSTFPIRQKIMIPVSKQDLMLQLIQKRFKSGYHF